jgi:hypothetical protein
LVILVLSSTSIRRSSTGRASILMAGLCTLSIFSLSLWLSSNSSASAASDGSSLAPLGVKASRYLASIAGLSGKITKKSYRCNALISGPFAISKQTGMGPWKRQSGKQRMFGSFHS